MQDYFIAVDGDNVGSRLEYFAITNNIDELTTFSKQFNAAMNWFEQELISGFSATVVFLGGDNLLASAKAENLTVESLEGLRVEFATKSRSTLSIGLGENPRQAYLALKLAKTNGKNAIRQYEELTND